jgi:hypothetical protein
VPVDDARMTLWMRITTKLRLDPPDHRALDRRLRPQRGPLIIGGEEQRRQNVEQIVALAACVLAGGLILALSTRFFAAAVSAGVGAAVLLVALRLKRQRPPG